MHIDRSTEKICFDGENAVLLSKILSDYLLITIFGNDISLGFLRLKVVDVVEKTKKILGSSEAE